MFFIFVRYDVEIFVAMCYNITRTEKSNSKFSATRLIAIDRVCLLKGENQETVC